MAVKGLKKIRGYSVEDVRLELEQHGIPYTVRKGPSRVSSYFRSTEIELAIKDKEARDATWEFLAQGAESVADGRMCLYAEYSIDPEFDLGQLNGNPRFKNGHLIERTRIR